MGDALNTLIFLSCFDYTDSSSTDEVPAAAILRRTGKQQLAAKVIINKQATTIAKQRATIKALRLKINAIRKKAGRRNPSKKARIDGIIDDARQLGVNEDMLSFMKSQLARSTSRKQQWSYSEKVLALGIYYHSPKTYQFLAKTFRLPSISSIRRWLTKIPANSGVNLVFREILKQCFEKAKPEDRVCALIFDEVSIKSSLSYAAGPDHVEGLEDFGPVLGRSKKIANQALVFMVRGLKQKWKQPIAYYFS
jgi:hypothetical protein